MTAVDFEKPGALCLASIGEQLQHVLGVRVVFRRVGSHRAIEAWRWGKACPRTAFATSGVPRSMTYPSRWAHFHTARGTGVKKTARGDGRYESVFAGDCAQRRSFFTSRCTVMPCVAGDTKHRTDARSAAPVVASAATQPPNIEIAVTATRSTDATRTAFWAHVPFTVADRLRDALAKRDRTVDAA